MLNYFVKNYRFYANAAIIVLVFLLLSLMFSVTFKYAFPVIISFLFYLLYKPFINLFNKKFSKKWSISLALTIVTLLFGGLFTGIGFFLYVQSINVIELSPIWLNWSKDMIITIFDWLKERVNSIPANYESKLKQELLVLLDSVADWAYSFATGLVLNATAFSMIVGQIVVGYILSIFLAFEADGIKNFLSSKISPKYKHFFNTVILNSLKGLGSYVKAQCILIFCTFSIISIALLILGVKNALLIGFISSALDIIPLLGVSTFFIPWILYLFIFGSTNIAIKLTILWLIVLLFRQVMEPRITGDSLGVSPFVMLASMLISTALLGIIGLVLSPVILLLIKSLCDEGYFSNWLFEKPLIQKANEG